MSKWIEVGKTEDIPVGQMKKVEADGVEILLANVDGEFHACGDRCGHQNVSLSTGKLEGKHVTCPLHGAVFDITTGESLEGIKLAAPEGIELPKEVVEMFSKTMEMVSKVKVEKLKTYLLKAEDGTIKVSID